MRTAVLERESLGAELHLIRAMGLGAAALMLDRIRLPAMRRAMQLDDVGDAGHTQQIRAQRLARERGAAVVELGAGHLERWLHSATAVLEAA